VTLSRTQRVMIVNPESAYYGQFGAITDTYPHSRTYFVRLDRTGAALVFGWSEVVPAPSGNKGIA